MSKIIKEIYKKMRPCVECGRRLMKVVHEDYQIDGSDFWITGYCAHCYVGIGGGRGWFNNE